MAKRGGRRHRKRKNVDSSKSDDEMNPKKIKPLIDISWLSLKSGDNGETLESVSPHSSLSPFDTAWMHQVNDSMDLERFRRSYNALSTHFHWPTPTLVQQHAWPLLLSSHNCFLIAPTGSGKTLAYTLPLLHRTGGLILVPTRELAIQVAENGRKWWNLLQTIDRTDASRNFCILSFHGGVDKAKHVQAFQEAAERSNVLVIATPGRFLDVLETASKSPTFSSLVLDEADRLASQADLSNQIESILSKLKFTSVCLCSATFPEKVRRTWTRTLQPCTSTSERQTWCVIRVDTVQTQDTDPTRMKVKSNEEREVEESARMAGEGSGGSGEELTTESFTHSPISQVMLARIPSNVTQTLHVCAEHKKPRKLIGIIQKMKASRKPGLGIVFFNRIKTVHFAVKLLKKEGINSTELHSQMDQKERESAVRTFVSGRIPLLLATDVAARGLHIEQVRYVINYDFPGNLEQYVHRCGRAGRGLKGQPATVYSFFTRNLAVMAPDLVRLLHATDQYVDPNLEQLIPDQCKPVNKRPSHGSGRAEKSYQPDDGDDSSFLDLASNRIVLQRASHVSDASSDDSLSDGEDNNDL